jgi:hypothetical protein
MHLFKTLLAALVIASAGTMAGAAQPATAGSATLAFNSHGDILAGSIYGITAVGEHPQAFGNRSHVVFAAGRRTISYACPIGPQATLTQDFSADAKYELICKPGQLPEIKRVDEC